MAYTRTDTSANILNDALVGCGLASVSAPFSSADPAIIQMRKLLNDCIQELGTMHDWTQFTREHTLTTNLLTNEYDLPEDFDHFVSQTGWNSTDQVPLGGPADAVYWQCLGNETLLGDLYIYFRQEQDKIFLLPNPPPDGKVLSFRYASRRYVRNGASTYKDYTDDPADVILFDPLLLRRFLILRFKEARGFDTTAAAQQFNSVYNSRVAANIAAPTLNLSRTRTGRLIDSNNLPESGYG